MANTGTMAAKKDGTIFRSIRTRAMLLFAMEKAGLEANRWFAGVKYQPRDCRPLTLGSSAWYCDDPGLDTLAAGADCVPFFIQYAFSIDDAMRDVTMGRTGDELRDELQARYNEMVSWAFAATLTGQNAGFTGITLPSQAHAPDPGYGAGTAMIKALAILENELADTLRGAVGLIHMSPGALLVANAGGALEVEGTEVRTPSGHKVVADAGYFKAAAPTGQSDAAVGTSEWIYASGPIEYEVQPFTVLGEGPNDYTDPFHNKLERQSQEQGIFLFDPCAVTAVLATY